MILRFGTATILQLIRERLLNLLLVTTQKLVR